MWDKMTSTGKPRAGSGSSRKAPRFLLSCIVSVCSLATACAPATTSEEAAATAEVFLAAMTRRDPQAAWAVLSEPTRSAYPGGYSAFSNDVTSANWESADFDFDVQSPVWLDVTWAVWAAIPEGSQALPSFLIERDLVSAWTEGRAGDKVTDRGIELFVEPEGDRLVVAGAGLAQARSPDSVLRPTP